MEDEGGPGILSNGCLVTFLSKRQAIHKIERKASVFWRLNSIIAMIEWDTGQPGLWDSLMMVAGEHFI